MDDFWVLDIYDYDDWNGININIYLKIPVEYSYDYLYKIVSSICYSYNKISGKYQSYKLKRGGSISYPGTLSVINIVMKDMFNEIDSQNLKMISENIIKRIESNEIKNYLNNYHNNEAYYCTEIYNKKIIYNRINNSQIFYDNDYTKHYFGQEKDEDLENDIQYKAYYKRNQKNHFYKNQIDMNHVLFNFEEIKDELSIDYYPDDKEIDKIVAIAFKKLLKEDIKEIENEC